MKRFITILLFFVIGRSYSQPGCCSEYYSKLMSNDKDTTVYRSLRNTNENQFLFSNESTFLRSQNYLYLGLIDSNKIEDPIGGAVVTFADGSKLIISPKRMHIREIFNKNRSFHYYGERKISRDMLDKFSKVKVKSYRLAGHLIQLDSRQQQFVLQLASCFLSIGGPFEGDVSGPNIRKKKNI